MIKLPCQMHHRERHQDFGPTEGNRQRNERRRADNDHRWPTVPGTETLLCHFNKHNYHWTATSIVLQRIEQFTG